MAPAIGWRFFFQRSEKRSGAESPLIHPLDLGEAMRMMEEVVARPIRGKKASSDDSSWRRHGLSSKLLANFRKKIRPYRSIGYKKT